MTLASCKLQSKGIESAGEWNILCSFLLALEIEFFFLICFCILQAQSNTMDVSVEINDAIKEFVPPGSFAGGYRCSSLLFLSRVDEAQVDFM